MMGDGPLGSVQVFLKKYLELQKNVMRTIQSKFFLKLNFYCPLFYRSEYGAFWKCVQAGGIYVFTQLCKMLVLATFFPTSDTNSHDSLDFIGVSFHEYF